jgi:hypothetical protein
VRSVDFLLELLVQLVVQVVVELLYELLLRAAWHGAAALVRNVLSGLALSFLAGLGLGILWGMHLYGNETWPKLFWVSVGLGLLAFAYAMTRPAGFAPRTEARRGGALLAPPWQWDPERLVGFALINAGIALGIAGSFGPGWSPVG